VFVRRELTDQPLGIGGVEDLGVERGDEALETCSNVLDAQRWIRREHTFDTLATEGGPCKRTLEISPGRVNVTPPS
jgi:hypothetical protein